MGDVLDTARAYLAAGLSVIPVRTDGSKAPVETDWRAYTAVRPTVEQLDHWFGNGHAGRYGIGIPGGAASGNLAVLDFEADAAFVAWLKSLSADAQKRTRTCPLARTPGGGAHLYARLPDPVPGVVLARHQPDPLDVNERTGLPRVKVLIEVRGDGHQVVAPGSPASCHKSGREYEWLRPAWTEGGSYAEVPWETWIEWLEKAAALNEYTPPPEPPRPDSRPRVPRAGTSPGDDFNHQGTWAETGLFDGTDAWKWDHQFGDDRGYATRPGKHGGTSATLGMVTSRANGWPLFYCFTTNGDLFRAGETVDRFGMYARMKHKGDFKAAAKALGERGYGDQRTAGWTGTASFRGGVRALPATGAAVPAGNTPHGGGPEQPDPQTERGAKPALPLVYYADVQPALDAADFVEGLLIDGAMSVIYGESGCGKTFFALDLALHVAAGNPWRGREVDRRGVLYLALEGGHGIRNRIAAYKLTANAAELPLAVVPVALDLLSPDGDTLRVIEAAKSAAEKLGVPVGLIVIDTLSRAIAGGNENASEDMGAVVRHVDLIRQALPAHVCVIHHSGKDTARGARGHSLLRAATDTEIEVSRDHLGTVSVARVTKQRELDLGDEFPFRLSAVALGVNRRGKDVTSCVVVCADPEAVPSREDRALEQVREKDRLKKRAEDKASAEADEAVLRAIDAERGKGTAAASESAIKKQAGVSKARVDEALKRLLDGGAIVASGPFKRAVGHGAMVTVKDGYQRAPDHDAESF